MPLLFTLRSFIECIADLALIERDEQIEKTIHTAHYHERFSLAVTPLLNG